jgi:hypothetical protein
MQTHKIKKYRNTDKQCSICWDRSKTCSTLQWDNYLRAIWNVTMIFGEWIQKGKTMSKFYQIIKENIEQRQPKTMEDNLRSVC